jgi:hypothetical protein
MVEAAAAGADADVAPWAGVGIARQASNKANIAAAANRRVIAADAAIDLDSMRLIAITP